MHYKVEVEGLLDHSSKAEFKASMAKARQGKDTRRLKNQRLLLLVHCLSLAMISELLSKSIPIRPFMPTQPYLTPIKFNIHIT